MAEKVAETMLKFRLRTDEHFHEVFKRFHPGGQTVLNSTEWMGKPPRTCGVTRVSGRPHPSDQRGGFVIDIEVSCRPKGCITYVGGTKYDGWTAMMLDRAKDGTYLDGRGKPLPPGSPPVFLGFELFKDTDYNQMEFGEFLGEFPVDRVRRIPYAEITEAMHAATRFCGSVSGTFLAARRSRPGVQIVIGEDLGPVRAVGGGRDRVVFIDRTTPHLSRVVLDHLTEFLGGFFEGRYSMGSHTFESPATGEITVLLLDDVLVDVRHDAEKGQQASRFNCLTDFVSYDDLHELAIRLMATYEVMLDLIEGEKPGFVLRRPPKFSEFQ